MPLIVCHAPKGGVGTSFVAAGIAQGLSLLGRDVVALDVTAQDSLKYYFGLPPEQALPDLEDEVIDQVTVGGVGLRSGWRAAQQPDFAEALRAGDLPFDGETCFVADVASADLALAQLLRRHARLHVCPLTPTAMTMAQLPRLSPGRALDTLHGTAFVLNQLDETRRFARHAAVFLRELLGDRLIAQIHRDEAVNEAVGMQQPLARYAPASAALADMGRLVLAVDALCTAAGPDHAASDHAARPGKSAAA
jgi:cellulose biosynthesis protein BcsQ